MTKRGLKYLSEARFDIDQLKPNVESKREEKLVSEIEEKVEELHDLQSHYYNRRKDEVVTKPSPSQN